MITGKEIVEQALTHLGTPFKHQGRNAKGLDCAGLAFMSHLPFLPQLAIPSDYPRIPDGNKMMLQLSTCGFTSCPPGDILNNPNAHVGKIALMRFASDPQHVGILNAINGRLYIIHAYSLSKTVVHHSIDEYWRSRIVSVWSHPDIIYNT